MRFCKALILVASLLSAVSLGFSQGLSGAEIQSILQKERNPPLGGQFSFKGHQVLTFDIRNQAELEELTKVIKKYSLDEWTRPHIGPVDVRVQPEFITAVRSSVRSPVKVKIPDLGEAILLSNRQADAQLRKSVTTPGLPNLDFSKSYHNYEELAQFVTKLNNDYKNITEVVSVGKSYEGRDMIGLRIRGKNPKKVFIFNGAQHAREWLTPAVTAYIMDAFTGLYGKDETITQLVDHYDIYAIPVMNPDGYKFTQSNRMWRKNRQPNPSSRCIGTNTDRNWDAAFGGPGSSNDPCDEAYHGPSAFSSPESKNMAEFIKSKKAYVYIDFHAYGQRWMWSYGDSCSKKPPNEEKLKKGAELAVNALAATHGSRFETGPNCSPYEISGSAVDWATEKGQVPFAYAVELRDQGRYGFVLPANQIIPSGEETLAGVSALLRYVMDN
ncbi:uncharacterized protein VTP21DRAFT_2236 [Calcarisporiella thermophila]|uniref:uncharacterized protein n=1 Tax=Calcarisporiella thermophila TaxID=911321 RepID=UPI00374221A8